MFMKVSFRKIKIKNLEKLFRKNKTSPLSKTPEKDFHLPNQFDFKLILIRKDVNG